MHELYSLKEKLCRELEEYSHKDITMATLDVIDKLAHAAKNVDKLVKSEGSSYRPYEDYSYREYGRTRDSRGRYSGRDAMDEFREMMHNMPPEVQGDMQKILDKMNQK